MSILLTVYNTPVWKTFAEAIGLPFINEATPKVNTTPAILQPTQPLSTLSELLSNLASDQVLWLAVVQAEYFLADALEAGETLASAAKQWEMQTKALLDLQRKQRKNLQLFNIHQALTEPTQFRQLISPTLVIHDYLKHTFDSKLSILAACQYVAQQPELQALNTRLQATVVPLCENEALRVNIEQVLFQSNHHKGDHIPQQMEKVSIEHKKMQQKINQLEAEVKTTTEERDLVLNQLQLVQEQLEQYYLTLQAEQQQHKHALLARDKQQTKEIAKLEAELRKTKARAANAEYAGQLLQKELEKLRASISWKAATPVRMLGRLIKKNDPVREQLMQEIGLLLTSEYFDVDWYLRTYTDVAESQMNPAEHYLLHGAAEGRLPGPLFDGNWYLQHYPDVAASNMNPLLHFVIYGQQEGRTSSPKLLTNNQSIEE